MCSGQGGGGGSWLGQAGQQVPGEGFLDRVDLEGRIGLGAEDIGGQVAGKAVLLPAHGLKVLRGQMHSGWAGLGGRMW